MSTLDTTRAVVLYGSCIPISGQTAFRDSDPYKEKTTLPRAHADVSELVCADFQHRLPSACTTQARHSEEPGALNVRSPVAALSTAGSMLPSRTCKATLERDRTLVTAFRSPATISAFADSVPGSKFPTCHFASQTPRFCCSFDPWAPLPLPVCFRSWLFQCFWPVAASSLSPMNCSSSATFL